MGQVTALFTADASGEPMIEQESVEIVAGGIVGDRYCSGRGTYSVETGCQVTLVAQSAVEHVRAAYDIDLSDGRHRRNVVTSGVDLRELLDATVRLGTAVVRGTRPRPPCAYLEELTETEGIADALGDGRGGICVEVREPGAVAVGDTVEILQPDPETAGERIAARLGDAERVDPEDPRATNAAGATDRDDHPTQPE